jgi:uncharacterized membrane protein
MPMPLFLKCFVIIHAIAGTVALLAGPVAMLTKKGGPLHQRAGRYYFYSMVGVFITAVVVAYLKSLTFLFMVAFFSFYLVLSGYRALRWKKLAVDGIVATVDWIIQLAAGLTAAVLLAWGAYQVIHGSMFGSVAIVFGAIALLRVWQTTRSFRTPPDDKLYWLYAHIIGMSGGYIATLTAFLVVNVHFMPSVIVWLVPTLIGVPLIISVLRRIRAKHQKKSVAVMAE